MDASGLGFTDFVRKRPHISKRPQTWPTCQRLLLQADYWKSQPRKFCEFCKCWLTDNKPSIEFHEKGKRHQENVKKKIETIKKKSLADAQKKSEMESDMEQLNKAALEAFKKDLMNDPSLAAQYGISLTKKKESSENKASEKKVSEQVSIKKEPAKDVKPQIKIEKSLTESTCKFNSSEVKPPKTQTDWYEAVSDEGYHYFWNIKTNESVWEAPTNYVSLEEQDQSNSADLGSNDQKEEKNEIKEESDVKVKLEPEDIKKEDDSEANTVIEGPLPRNSNTDNRTWAETCTSRKAYGDWVTYEEEAPVDYELPDVPTNDIPLPEYPEEEAVKVKFKEKRVISLSHSGDVTAVAFKKRKVTKGARNVRSRDDSDE